MWDVCLNDALRCLWEWDGYVVLCMSSRSLLQDQGKYEEAKLYLSKYWSTIGWFYSRARAFMTLIIINKVLEARKSFYD